MKLKLVTALFLLSLIAFVITDTARAQTSVFSYQGTLSDGNAQANGMYDFRFTLFGQSSGGSALTSTITWAGVTVNKGVFTVVLNFGSGVFDGGDRWLEIAARPTGAGVFTTLNPRQPMTSTPYAIRSKEAASVPAGAITAAMIAPGAIFQLGSPDGSPSNAVTVDNNGLVGMGTSTPAAGLHVVAGKTFVSPEVLSFVVDEFSGYTLLDSPRSVAVQGTLVAVASSPDDGITLFDIATPSSPIFQSQIQDGDGAFTSLNGAVSVAMKTNLLAVAASSDDAVTLVDVSNPAIPVKLSEIKDGVGGFNELNGATAVAIAGNLMAVAASTDNAVTLVDISTPSAPVKRVEMKDGVFGFDFIAGPATVALLGNLLAIGAATDNAVTLVDVTNPVNPSIRAVLRDGVGGYNSLATVAGVALSGNLLAVSASSDSAVTLVDVSNPASPVKLAELKDGVNAEGLEGAKGVAISGNMLAVAGRSEDAVAVIDISSPANPVVVAVARNDLGGFNRLSSPYSVAFAGANLVVAGELSDAVTVLQLATRSTGVSTQNRLGIGTTQPAGALHVVGDVVVEQANRIELTTTHFETGTETMASGNYSTAMGLETTASGSYSTALGYSTNARASFSTAMGASTTASGAFATAMGNTTTASGNTATAMGRLATASGNYSTAMGFSTNASGDYSIASGYDTTASGDTSTAMGYETAASGTYSTALGYKAQATHQGSFVWADSNSTTVASAADNSLTFRAAGGYRLFSNAGATAGVSLAPNATAWAVLSDRAVKKDIAPVNRRAILEKLAAIPITQWRYQWEDAQTTPNIGPMAQDFKSAFYPGRDDKTITTQETDGVVLAALQGLNEKVEMDRRRSERRMEELENENTALKLELGEIKRLLEKLSSRESRGF